MVIYIYMVNYIKTGKGRK